MTARLTILTLFLLNLIFDGLGVFWICKGTKTLATRQTG
jgi:hypothetical protein